MWYVFILPHRAPKPVKVRFALKTLTGGICKRFIKIVANSAKGARQRALTLRQICCNIWFFDAIWLNNNARPNYNYPPNRSRIC